MIFHINESINTTNNDANRKFCISNFIYLLTVLQYSGEYLLMLEAIVSGNSLNNSLNNSFNKKVSNKSTIYTCQYWKCFRSSYFSHLHLHRRVHFNFALMHLHREQVLVQVHFTSNWNTSLARGCEIQMGSSLPSSSFHP